MNIGIEIELELRRHYLKDQKYMSQARSLISNFRDKTNEDLRKRIIDGDISPLKIVTLTPDELASEKKKK